MAKNEMTKSNTGTAITAAQDTGPIMQGFDQSDFLIPVAWLFQGTGEESEAYPNAKRGEITSRLLGSSVPSRRFILLKAWKSWVRFDKGSATPAYTYDDEADVPAEDLKWGEDGTPPAATETINTIILFEGLEEVPHIFRFKKTSYNEGKNLLTIARFVRGKMFEFADNKVGENSEGKKYLIPTCRPTADAIPEAMLAMRSVFLEAETQGRVKIDDGDAPF
jgi:hypothetical protein